MPEPCSGSGKLPAGASHADSLGDNPGILEKEMCCSPVPASLEKSNTNPTEAFSTSSVNVGLVRHIPRSVRQRAAVVLNCVSGMLPG